MTGVSLPTARPLARGGRLRRPPLHALPTALILWLPAVLVVTLVLLPTLYLALRALEAGAAMINDIYALRLPGALETAASLGVPVCLMHMQGRPETMQEAPRYGDVVAEVSGFLRERMAACRAVGIPQGHILVDPGFGFGKTLEHNYRLLAGLRAVATLGVPVLVGLSRKRMLGEVSGRPVRERVHAGVAAAALAVLKGAATSRGSTEEDPPPPFGAWVPQAANNTERTAPTKIHRFFIASPPPQFDQDRRETETRSRRVFAVQSNFIIPRKRAPWVTPFRGLGID